MAEQERPPAFGQKDANGKVAKDTLECAVSGLKIEPGDVYRGITGTPLFYRVKSFIWHKLTPAGQVALEDRIRAAAGFAQAQGAKSIMPEAPAPSRPARSAASKEE